MHRSGEEVSPLQPGRSDLVRDRALIGGRWVGEVDGRIFAVLDPADGSHVIDVPDCGATEASAAVDCAAEAFRDWSARTGKERSQLLRQWNGALLAHQEDLARLLSREQGKPLAESRGEVAAGAAYVEWFAEEAKRAYGDVIPEPTRGRKLIVVDHPPRYQNSGSRLELPCAHPRRCHVPQHAIANATA